MEETVCHMQYGSTKSIWYGSYISTKISVKRVVSRFFFRPDHSNFQNRKRNFLLQTSHRLKGKCYNRDCHCLHWYYCVVTKEQCLPDVLLQDHLSCVSLWNNANDVWWESRQCCRQVLNFMVFYARFKKLNVIGAIFLCSTLLNKKPQQFRQNVI